MISVEEALRVTESAFPSGPERLAEMLGAEILRSPLNGAAGWCVRGLRIVIRLNSSDPEVRQRFTMAHELAHLLQGTKPDIAGEEFSSADENELAADRLASELLLPTTLIRKFVSADEPVDFRSIRRLAESANVSPVAVAYRVANAFELLGLPNAGVARFPNGGKPTLFSRGFRLELEDAQRILEQARTSHPDVCRVPLSRGVTVSATLMQTPGYELLFVQLLPADVAAQPTRDERLRELAGLLFGSDLSFRQSVAARLGGFRAKSPANSLADATTEFLRPVELLPAGSRDRTLLTPTGREYVRLFLSKWFS